MFKRKQLLSIFLWVTIFLFLVTSAAIAASSKLDNDLAIEKPSVNAIKYTSLTKAEQTLPLNVTRYNSLEEAKRGLAKQLGISIEELERQSHEHTSSTYQESLGTPNYPQPQFGDNRIFIPDCPGPGVAWVTFYTGLGTDEVQFWGNHTWRGWWSCLGSTCWFDAFASLEQGDSIWYVQVSGNATITNWGCNMHS